MVSLTCKKTKTMELKKEDIIKVLENNTVWFEALYEDLIHKGRFEDIANEIVKLTIPDVKNWVAVKDSMPKNCDQVFVKYENGKYGINEWWESEDCWKYQFDNMIVKEWCKPPCS